MTTSQKQRHTRRTKGPGNHGYLKGGACPPEYRAWVSMVQRCLNPNCHEYPLYGGRGIRVCGRWLERNGFAHFMSDLGSRPKSKCRISLHRLDNDGHYEPGNVAWADQK